MKLDFTQRRRAAAIENMAPENLAWLVVENEVKLEAVQGQRDGYKRLLTQLLTIVGFLSPCPGHEGSCGPEANCDGVCIDAANVGQVISQIAKAITEPNAEDEI